MQREPITEVLGNTVDLINQSHHLLLAGGITLFAQSVGPHLSNRLSSQDRYWLTGEEPTTPTTTTTTTVATPPSEDDIYNNCDTTKLCFGIPANCVASRDCNLLATVFYNDGDFEFELLSKREFKKIFKKN